MSECNDIVDDMDTSILWYICILYKPAIVGYYPQVILLQYCRGGGACRRDTSATELELLLTTNQVIDHSRLRCYRTYRECDFNRMSVDLAEAHNYYIVFSTLSDSKYDSSTLSLQY